MLNTFSIGNTEVLRTPLLDPLGDDQLKKFAPTIFARGGMPGVSEKYGHVSTIGIVRAMRDSGFECVEVRQTKKRNPDLQNFAKHMMKFRPTGLVKKLLVGDVIQQVCLLNSHDRTSGFHLYHALFRLICANGMLVSDGPEVVPIKIHHSVRLVENIIDRSQQLVKGADGVYALRDHMLNTAMTERSAVAFAAKALEFRPPGRIGVIEPKALLEVRRPEDNALDLWHVFNRVQENMLRGGNETRGENGRIIRTRGIGRIERDVEFNRAVWSLAVETINKASSSAKKAVKRKEAVEI